MVHADPPSGQLQTDGLQVVNTDAPIDITSPFLAKVREAVASLRDGKASGDCDNSVKLLKAGGVVIIHGLLAILALGYHIG